MYTERALLYNIYVYKVTKNIASLGRGKNSAHSAEGCSDGYIILFTVVPPKWSVVPKIPIRYIFDDFLHTPAQATTFTYARVREKATTSSSGQAIKSVVKIFINMYYTYYTIIIKATN